MVCARSSSKHPKSCARGAEAATAQNMMPQQLAPREIPRQLNSLYKKESACNPTGPILKNCTYRRSVTQPLRQKLYIYLYKNRHDGSETSGPSGAPGAPLPPWPLSPCNASRCHDLIVLAGRGIESRYSGRTCKKP